MFSPDEKLGNLNYKLKQFFHVQKLGQPLLTSCNESRQLAGVESLQGIQDQNQHMLARCRSRSTAEAPAEKTGQLSPRVRSLLSTKAFSTASCSPEGERELGQELTWAEEMLSHLHVCVKGFI